MEQRINNAYLLIGGNMGNREAMLASAQKKIGENCGQLLRFSSIYETEPWGKTNQPAFLNQVVEIATWCTPTLLLERVLAIEQEMGRQRMELYGPRLVDIDILLFNQDVIQLPELVVPHPHMAARRFVLTPLAELAPHYRHPLTLLTIRQMLDQCTDPLHVYKW